MLWRRSRTHVPFEVACICGHPLRGARQRRHQVLPCPLCGRRIFVLPVSPFLNELPQEPEAKPPSRRRRLTWAMPVLAGALLLTLLGLAFLLLVPYLGRAPSAPEDKDPETLQRHINAGRDYMNEGRFHQRRPGLVTATDGRRLMQMYRQSSLLANLLGRSLQEVLQEAGLVRDDEEWKARFKQDYAGKAVVFDDLVKRDAAGRPALASYVVRAGDQTVRLALEDVSTLSMKEMPLNPPQRLLFGVRLAEVAREPGGGWVVRFQPDSGVLLTDTAATAAVFPGPLDDELIGLLQRQTDLVTR